VQVEAALALSLVVRPGPVRTAVNGTLVARPVRTDPVHRGAVGSTLTVRPVLGDQLPRWQGSKEPRQRPRWSHRTDRPAAPTSIGDVHALPMMWNTVRLPFAGGAGGAVPFQ